MEATQHLGKLQEARHAAGPRVDTKWLIIGVSVAIVAWLALIPLAFLLWQSFMTPETASVPARFTWENYRQAYTSAEGIPLFFNSIQFATGTAVFSLLVGTFFAWVNERTNTPFKPLFFVMSIDAPRDPRHPVHGVVDHAGEPEDRDPEPRPAQRSGSKVRSSTSTPWRG